MKLDISNWDRYDWTIAALVGFAVVVGFSAFGSAARRLR